MLQANPILLSTIWPAGPPGHNLYLEGASSRLISRSTSQELLLFIPEVIECGNWPRLQKLGPSF